jgi:hypothetical protein
MKSLLPLTLLAFTLPAMAAKTADGYVACTTEAYLNQAVRAAGAKDFHSFDALVDNRRCTLLRGGLPVTVLQYPGMFEGHSQFLLGGRELWTVRKGIDL